MSGKNETRKERRGLLVRQTPSGFTLVEIIVVAAIVGILSAVAIPVYFSYVTSSRKASVDQLAQTAAAANGYWRKTGDDPAVADLNLFYDSGKYDITRDADAGTITVVMKEHADINKMVPYR